MKEKPDHKEYLELLNKLGYSYHFEHQETPKLSVSNSKPFHSKKKLTAQHRTEIEEVQKLCNDLGYISTPDDNL